MSFRGADLWGTEGLRAWEAGEPHIARASAELVDVLNALAGSAEALLAARTTDVELLGPSGFRSNVRAETAAAFLANGYNLYLRGLEADVPGLRDVFASIAADVGFGPKHVYVEAFIGRAGQVSTRHYDHDINFQVLLSGRKEWRLQANPDIANPLQPYHPGVARRFREEAYSKEQATPAPNDDRWSKHIVEAGDVVFVPRGTWHEVVSLTDTLAINLVLKGITYAAGLVSALEARLHRAPAFRAYLDGFAIGDATPPSRTAQFEALKTAAIDALNEITLEEAALTPYRAQRFEWIADPSGQGLDEDTGGAARTLASLREPFTWDHALLVLDRLGAIRARNVVEELIDRECLKVIE